MAGDADVIHIGTVGAFRPKRPLLVPLAVSREKLNRELAEWEQNRDLYAQRGWLLLGADDVWVEIAILQKVGNTAWPVVGACVGLDYRNYDLEPPSLTFIDPLTRTPVDPAFKPHQLEGQQLRLLVPGEHPSTKRPFLCLPGIWEYHSHPEHDGDSWLAGHRAMGAGRLANIANHLWSTTRIAFTPEIQINAKFTPVLDAVAVQMAQAEVAGGVPQTPEELGREDQADDPVALAHDEGAA